MLFPLGVDELRKRSTQLGTGYCDSLSHQGKLNQPRFLSSHTLFRQRNMSTEELEIKASDGAVMKLYKYHGKLLPYVLTEPEVRIPAINNLEGKDGDVILVSYPKTGTNWVTDMLIMLKQNKVEVGMTLGSIMLELSSNFDTVMSQSEPRTFATHLDGDCFNESLLKKAKIVLVCRNPKDAAVSMFHHLKRDKRMNYQGQWNGFYELYAAGMIPYGSYFDYYRNWEQALKKNGCDFLLVFYEDFHFDSVGTLRKLCDFLGYDRSDEILQAITDKCKIQTIQKEKEAIPAVKQLIEKMSNDQSLPFYRKGVIGDWKNHFTVAQNEAFDKLIEEKMKDTMYKFRWEMPQ